MDWRVFPADLLPIALKKGEIQAFTGGDPLSWVLTDRDDLFEVATNLDGEYAHRACCVLGVRGSLIRDDRPAAAAVTEAILEAQDFVASNPGSRLPRSMRPMRRRRSPSSWLPCCAATPTATIPSAPICGRNSLSTRTS